ncbi:hypothetical protein UK23_08870 [Lentzea aerocolonigenes]|uniref:Uncharacterized protein n=1 Tax=Lentzea aerocolonigenes TaxID=68170 RepID=A0A0F0H634_LENAE|nr:hypothetical protein [Lentzea aerocolonigenes]KJK50950.1 hypothetical protein UK23_08870 [Lentzea aerocolonigenes]
MPEQPSISITVSIAPHVAHGLHALVQKTLREATPAPRPKDDRGSGKNVNKSTGTVNGTLFQIGNVHGGIHHHGNR